MKKIYIRNVFIGLSFVTVLSSAIMNVSGPGGGYTNAPGDYGNCTSCHGGSIITSSNANLANIRLEAPWHGTGYLPDSTYDIALTFKQSSKVKFGMQVTVLDKSNNAIGTLTNLNTRTSRVTASPGGKSREYIQHTSTGTAQVATDSTRWLFRWKAPSTNVGKISFHVVVMATNNNGSQDAGDAVYGKRFDIPLSSYIPAADAFTNDSVSCTNYTIQMKGSGTATPTSYSWKFSAGATPGTSSAQNPTVVFTTSGLKLAILTAKNAYGTSQPDTFKINISSNTANAVINNSNPSAICKGDSLQLTYANSNNSTYLLMPVNKVGRTNIFIKDTGFYKLKVTNTISGCTATTADFRLNWNPEPTISIAKGSSSDTFCGSYNQTLTATGALIDSVLWYADNVLVRRSKGNTTVFTGTGNVTYTAVAKSSGGCRSVLSNAVKMVVIPKLLPSNIITSKTTSSINLSWKNAAGSGAKSYSLNKVNYNPTTTDSTLVLTGLNPNTTYDVTIRTLQPSPCTNGDTTISVKTNACSNLSYVVDMPANACKGTPIKATVKQLYNAKYSISFNNQPYSKDTTFIFTPQQSDSLLINIIDSLSPTCPPLVEKIAYHLDTLIDKDTGSLIKFTANICDNNYLYSIKPVYTSYEFYKNNVLVNSGANASFMFTGLATGDKLTAIGKINSCQKVYGPVSIVVNSKPTATYTYTRSWKTYTLTADNNGHSEYKWYAGTTLLGSGNPLVADFTSYNNSNIDVKLVTKSTPGCKDSSSQSITVPNFSSVNTLQNQVFNIYPNPFGDKITIESQVGKYDVRIINNLGQVVYTSDFKGAELNIETADWTSGLYYIVIRDENNGLSSFKFVKQ